MKYIIKQNRSVGFFSSFNMIVGALKFLHDNSIDNFFIDWKNNLYQNEATNLFDKYFYQQLPLNESGIHYEATQIGNVYLEWANSKGIDVSIFDRELFLQLNKILKLYGHFDNEIYKKCKSSCVKLNNSLGVHVRGTDHHHHGELLPIEYYFEIIDKKITIGEYKNILLITDENKNIEIFKQKYGDMVYVNHNIDRSTNGSAIHYSKFSDLDKLVLDVMSDAISLSMCDEILITSSNVSAYTLMLNPNIKFEQIDLHIKYS